MNLRLFSTIRSSWVNTAGLALGFATFIITALWVYTDQSFDRYNDKVKQLVRVTRHETSPQGSTGSSATTPGLLGPILAENIPEVSSFTRFYRLENFLGEVQIESSNHSFFEKGYCFADPSIFELFGFRFISGNAGQALSTPNAVVITEEIARKYFGSIDPMGENIKITEFGEYTVTGILQNIPKNSHLKFDFVSPVEPLMKKYTWMTRWNIPHFYTYLKLSGKSDPAVLNKQIEQVITKMDIQSLKALQTQYDIQAVTSIHLQSELSNELEGNGKYISNSMKIFILLSTFILVISCLNFMIIFIAKAFEKRREIALRKIIGASRYIIARSYLIQTFTLVCLGFFFGLLVAIKLIPSINQLIGQEISLLGLSSANIILILIITIILASILSGFYPAVFISSFRPSQIMRGVILHGGKRSMLIKGFVIIQYVLSLFFIIGTFVFFSQYRFMTKKEIGYKPDQILCIRDNKEMKPQFEAFKTSLISNPNIKSVSSCSELPNSKMSTTVVKGWEGADPDAQIMMDYLYVDLDFLKTMEIGLKKGRDFEFITDLDNGFIINEEAEKQMGFKDALGKSFTINGLTGNIIGVTKDFNYGSLISPATPLVIKVQPRSSKYIFISLVDPTQKDVLTFIEQSYNKFSSTYHFDSWSLGAVVKDLYKNEKKSAHLILVFSILGLMIAGMGLYGLVSYSVRLRIHEIGIRKTLGAKWSSILSGFLKEYGMMILVASLISWTVSLFYYNHWLNNYASRTDIKIWYLMGSTSICLIITACIVLVRSISTAIQKPVLLLKSLAK